MNVKNKNKNKFLSCLISAALILSALIPVILCPITASAETRVISFDTTYQDSMTSSSTTNLYYFDTTSTGTVLIKFETSTATKTNSWRVSLAGLTDENLYAIKDFGAADASSGASTRTEYSDLIKLPAGKYYIWVYVPQDATLVTNSYKITVSFYPDSGSGSSTNPGGPTGNNNTIQNAYSMNLNTTVTGSLKSAADVNYFKITVPYHGSLNLSFSVGSAIDSGNWIVLLYDKSERQLQMSRAGSGGEVINLIRTNKLDKLRLPPGEYYIKVAPYSSASYSSANYTIYADYTPERSAKFEREFNDTPDTATNILINAAVTGNLSNSADKDYFKFTAAEHRNLKIEFTTPDTVKQNMWTIYLQDSKGGVKTYYAGESGTAVNGKRTFISEELILDTGIYYIVVYPYFQDSSNLSNLLNPSGAILYTNADYSLLVRSDSAPVPEILDDEYIYPTEIPAAAYGVNRELTGQINNSSDINNFDFGLNYNGSVTIDFVSPNTVIKQAWILNIFDKNNKLLYSGKYGDEGSAIYSSATKTKTSDKIRIPAGSYYAQVLPINAYDYSNASYKLIINYSPEAKEALFPPSDIDLFETEYNNTPYTASNLNIGAPLTGNLSDYNDIDYFKFTLAQNNSVNIIFDSPRFIAQNDWVIELFTSDFTTESIYKSNFGADGDLNNINSEYKTTKSKNIRLQPGTYYIKVSAYNIINYSNKDYKIKVDFTGENLGYGLYETEHNNTPETANLLPVNRDMTGDISNIADIDYFKICVNKSQDIQIKFSIGLKVNENLWSIKLYDANKLELKSYKVGEGGVLSPAGATPSALAESSKYFKTEKIYLIPGDYYISISPYSQTDYSNEEYTLKVLDEAGQKIEGLVYPSDKPSEWAQTEVGFAYGYNLVPQNYMRNFTSPIKREEFCMLIIKFLEVAEDKPVSEILAENNKSIAASVFKDTSDIYILSAYALGLVNGRGDGIFDPNGNITREEAAAMLMRVGIFENINMNITPLDFKDDYKFSDWAVNAITYVSGCIDIRNNRIMNGYTDGGFHPGDTYSREQAFMTIFRIFAIKTGV